MPRPAQPSPSTCAISVLSPPSGEPRQVQVVDRDNRLLALCPQQTVSAQRLHHRAVAVLAFSREGKLILQKKRVPERKHAVWGVPLTRLTYGEEAQQDIADRLLAALMGTKGPLLYKKSTTLLPSGHGPMFLTTFSTGRTALPVQLRSLLAVDADEMRELAAEFSDLIDSPTSRLWQRRRLLLRT